MSNRFLSSIKLNLTIVLTCFCMSCAGNYSMKESGNTARLVFSGNRALTFADLSDITLKGAFEGSSAKTLGSWASGSELNGVVIEIEAGDWDFTLTANANFQNQKGTASATLVAGENNVVSFKMIGNDVYTVPATALSSSSTWYTSGTRESTITITGLDNSNKSQVGTSLLYYIDSVNGKTNLILNGSITSIVQGDGFGSKNSLLTIRLPEGITQIAQQAFSYDTSLTSIIIPASAIQVGKQICLGCTNISSITFLRNTGWTSNASGGGSVDVSNPAANASFFINNANGINHN